MIKAEIRNLSKKYNGCCALNIARLDIMSGEILGLLGNNGAGKTTLLRLMLDLIQADSGYVRYNQMDCSAKKDHWKEYTGAFLDNDFLIDFLYPEEYFLFAGGLHGLKNEEIFERLKRYEFFFNGEILENKKLIRDLSSGNKQKTGIVSAMIHEPEIMILDEPFNMIDPSSKIRLNGLLKDMHKRTNGAIILSSNILESLTTLCSRIVLLEKGEIIKNEKVSPAYIKELENYFSVSADFPG